MSDPSPAQQQRYALALTLGVLLPGVEGVRWRADGSMVLYVRSLQAVRAKLLGALPPWVAMVELGA
jgi:hypothetical protein